MAAKTAKSKVRPDYGSFVRVRTKRAEVEVEAVEDDAPTRAATLANRLNGLQNVVNEPAVKQHLAELSSLAQSLQNDVSGLCSCQSGARHDNGNSALNGTTEMIHIPKNIVATLSMPVGHVQACSDGDLKLQLEEFHRWYPLVAQAVIDMNNDRNLRARYRGREIDETALLDLNEKVAIETDGRLSVVPLPSEVIHAIHAAVGSRS